MRRDAADCFARTFVRCKDVLPRHCRYFPTTAEERIMNALREEGAPYMFLVFARQGTGKTLLAVKLAERILEDESTANVLPVVMCGRHDLHNGAAFFSEFRSAVLSSLLEWIKRRRGIRQDSARACLESPECIYLFANAAGLRLFVVVDEAFMAADLSKLMERLRELAQNVDVAGVLLAFQDRDPSIEGALMERGGSRFIREEITEQDLKPSPAALKDVEEWGAQALGDRIAGMIYAALADRYGFRSANQFGYAYLNAREFGKGGDDLSRALEEALRRRYGAARAKVGACESDLSIGGAHYDVKVCTDQRALSREVEEDRRRGCGFKYIVVGLCEAPGSIKIGVDVGKLLYALEVAARSSNIAVREIYALAAEKLAELIDLGVPVPADRLAQLAEGLCKRLGSSGARRSDLLRDPQFRMLAAELGVSPSKAEDVTAVIREVQKRYPRIRLVGAWVKCP